MQVESFDPVKMHAISEILLTPQEPFKLKAYFLQLHIFEAASAKPRGNAGRNVRPDFFGVRARATQPRLRPNPVKMQVESLTYLLGLNIAGIFHNILHTTAT